MGIAAWGDCEVEITTGGGLGRSERARQCKKTSAPLTRDGSELQRGGVGGYLGREQPHNNSAAEVAPRRSGFVYAKRTWLASGCGPLMLHGYHAATNALPSQGNDDAIEAS
ncbi:hypothetical protein IG631_19838 [Alternaria alternata]|nr:hypothetical protein IG631_19838 [Alternaria alternata]